MNYFITLLCLTSSVLIFTADHRDCLVPDYKTTLKSIRDKNLYWHDTIVDIKALAQHETLWKTCLNNSYGAGKVIKHTCTIYHLTAPTHVAIYLGTTGAFAWCKETAQDNAEALKDLAGLLELECFTNEPNRTLITDVLQLGCKLPPHFALKHFAGYGDFSLVKLFLDHGTDVNSITKIDGCTALMNAAVHKCNDIVALLLDRGAQVNSVDNKGQTALMFACEKCSLSIVHLLVAAGANVHARDKNNKDALWYARQFGYYENNEKFIYITDFITKKMEQSVKI